MNQAMHTPEMPDIFGANNHQEWLKDWLRWKKSVQPDYSVRQFAIEAKQASLTILEAVIARRRNLTISRAVEMAPTLSLQGEALARFLLLVQRERAEAGVAGGTAAERTLQRITRELDGLDEEVRYRLRPKPKLASVADLDAAVRGGDPFHLISLDSSTAVAKQDRALLKDLHATSGRALKVMGEDPASSIARLGRMIGLTQALATSNLPAVDAEIRGFLRSLIAEFGREPRPGTATTVLTVAAFPLTCRMPSAPPPATEQPAEHDLDEGGPYVHSYDDYRLFIEHWFQAERQRAAENGVKFSLRTFAEAAGLSDRTLPHKIVTGRQGLTETTARQVARGMGLEDDEEEFLVLLALRAQAEDVDKPHLDQQIRTARVLAGSRRMRARALRLFTDWFYFAIHELALCPGAPRDAAGVAAALRPNIGESEASHALTTLLELKMIERAPAGGWVSKDAALIALREIHAEVLHPALYSYHLRMHEMALESLTQTGRTPAGEPGTRVHALALPIADGDLHRLHEKMNEFGHHLLGFCGGLLPNADSVYQVNLQLLPLQHLRPARAA